MRIALMVIVTAALIVVRAWLELAAASAAEPDIAPVPAVGWGKPVSGPLRVVELRELPMRTYHGGWGAGGALPREIVARLSSGLELAYEFWYPKGESGLWRARDQGAVIELRTPMAGGARGAQPRLANPDPGRDAFERRHNVYVDRSGHLQVLESGGIKGEVILYPSAVAHEHDGLGNCLFRNAAGVSIDGGGENLGLTADGPVVLRQGVERLECPRASRDCKALIDDFARGRWKRLDDVDLSRYPLGRSS